ncbi:Nucleoside phosphatase GDA1/CD39 [Melia azedarach]|uniref:Nucleoside phosphatase GDA1/CD39 n=1 Tax=Melia azedarach TaxID=155640 RepID=A0ACC1YM41_MELAZ|nr:Nucleoside phosphatase GDA1/CD39 [Melia azedarach]
MEFSNLQSRVSSPYIPPHRTQLHPRMHSFSPAPSHPNSKLTNKRNKLLILLAPLLIIPFLYYLFSNAQQVHQSAKFAEPNVLHFYGIVIDSAPSVARVRVFKFVGEGQTPFVDSMRERGDVDRTIGLLIGFAKIRVPKKEWENTKVQLLVNGEVRDGVLEKCRRVLRASGFAFKDSWARVIEGEDKGMYAWIATNYALGTLGGEPDATVGIVELGGASLKVTFATRELAPEKSSKVIRFTGVNYNLYTQSLPEFGQDAAWKSVHEPQNSTFLKSFSSSGRGIIDNPCIPKGYELTSDMSNLKLLMSRPAGNFSACRFEALALLKRRQVIWAGS